MRKCPDHYWLSNTRIINARKEKYDCYCKHLTIDYSNNIHQTILLINARKMKHGGLLNMFYTGCSDHIHLPSVHDSTHSFRPLMEFLRLDTLKRAFQKDTVA